MKVIGARLENGLLSVDLEREVPEALKPRRIAIGGSQAALGQDNARVQNASVQVEHQVEDRSKAA
ncbi:molecular chaperone IbpA [Methylobacterium sp. ap11]|nr:molecular chaperone IbpA [Methylobacterium sp. ap11]